MRRLTMLSGSKLQLASLCVFWAHPDVPHADVGPRSERQIGTAVHRCIQNYVDSGTADVSGVCFGLSSDDTKTVANMYNAWWTEFASSKRDNWRAEVTYAFDAVSRSVRELGQNLERRYEEAGIRPTEIPVTVDMVFDEDEKSFVYDWKTGVHKSRQEVHAHSQLRAGAYCAARVMGRPFGIIIIVYIDEDGVSPHQAELSEFDFAAIEEELVGLYNAVINSPSPSPGPHCAEMWCPAIMSCPAPKQAQKDVEDGAKSPSTAVIVSNAAAIRSKEQAATMYAKLKQHDALSEACWRALNAYVDANGPVPLPDGREYAAVEKSRDSIRLTAEAVEFVRSSLGEHADSAIKTSISKESIKDATMAMVGGGKKRTAIEKGLLLGLESLGAIHVSTFTTHEAIKAKKTESP